MGLSEMRGQILERAVCRQSDIECAGRIDDSADLLEALERYDVELALMDLADGGLPAVCDRALERYPRLRMIAVEDDGRSGFIYELRPQRIPLGEFGEQALVSAIRNAPAFPRAGGR